MSILGGARATLNGFLFEQKTDLVDIVKSAGYSIKTETITRKKKKYYIHVLYEGSHRIGYFANKWVFYYGFLEKHGIDWRTRISKQYFPDEAFINEVTNTVYIIEKKFQIRHGSTDEKLESCAFKLDRYQHLVAPTGMNVEYTYLCNSWFQKPKYRDVIDYVRKHNCGFYFNSLPLHALGLTADKNRHPQQIDCFVGVFLFFGVLE